MSLKLAVDCDSCGKGMDEGDAIVCWKCYAEAADELEGAKKRIDELENIVSSFDEARELRIRNTEPQDNAPSGAVKSE
jgi:hypothetical protein